MGPRSPATLSRFSAQNVSDGGGMPLATALGGDALAIENVGNRLEGHSVGAKRRDAINDGQLGLVLLQLAFVDLKAERWRAHVLALGDLVLERGAGALADDLPLPLGDSGHDVEDHSAGSAGGVDLFGDREEGIFGSEVLLQQIREVADGTGEAVQLGYEEPGGLAAIERAERGLQPVAMEILGRDAGVDHDVDQVEVVELGVLLELGALGLQADSALRLLVGADPDVTDDFHPDTFDIEPSNHAELSPNPHQISDPFSKTGPFLKRDSRCLAVEGFRKLPDT